MSSRAATMASLHQEITMLKFFAFILLTPLIGLVYVVALPLLLTDAGKEIVGEFTDWLRRM